MLKTSHLRGGLCFVVFFFFLNQGQKLKAIVNVNRLDTDKGKCTAHAYGEMQGGL